MAPTTEKIGQLFARYYCSGYGYNSNDCRSSWSWWGRWVFAGVAIFVVILALVLLGCRNSRRRRKNGLNPRYGTGWMAPAPKYSPQNNPGVYAPPPPQYTPAPGQNQGYNNNNNNNYQGYYGGQQEGIQPPQGAYYPPGNTDNYYQAPPGPPPNK